MKENNTNLDKVLSVLKDHGEFIRKKKLEEKANRKIFPSNSFRSSNGRQGQSKRPRGRFFFAPNLLNHWASRSNKGEIQFLYSHSTTHKKKMESIVHVFLYSRLKFPKLGNNSYRWQQVVSEFSFFKENEEKLKEYVDNYQRMMRSRRFPEWQEEKEKDAREKSYTGWTAQKGEMYFSFAERKWKILLKSLLEPRLLRLFFSPKEKLKLQIHFIKSPWLTSSLCARYFLWRLRQRRCNFKRLLKNFVSYTQFYGGEKHNLYGIFISGAGRFTKKQRASYVKVQRGRVPFSTPTAPMDYTDVSIPLKYGACSVRVWVCHLREK